MNTRAFGSTGWTVGEVGLGTWQFGGDWGDVSEAQAMEILRTSLEEGVNFFDTADVYGQGRSEEILGRFLREQGGPGEGVSRIVVATKLGRYPLEDGADRHTRASYRKFTEASLARLGLDVIDLLQLHCVPTAELERGECFEWLRELQSEGKIRQFGASVESMNEAQICLKQEGLASLQIIFNVFRQKPILALFDDARAKGVALIARLPLNSGLLTGKYTLESTFPEQDHRHYNRDGAAFNVGETFGGLPFEVGVELVERWRLCVPGSQTLAETALRWCLDYEAISVVIPGAKTPEMARENAAASLLPPLSPSLHTVCDAFYRTAVAPELRGPI